MRRWYGLLIVVIAAAPAYAAVKPHELFCDHMVLQAGREIPVWGTASPGERVTVELQMGKDGVKSDPVVADKNGRFMVKLPAQTHTAADAPAGTLTISGDNKVVIQDVLIGEVWICSGQSNMEWPVSRSSNSKEAVEKSADPGFDCSLCPEPRA